VKDTDRENPARPARPAWAAEPDVVEQGPAPRPRRERLPRQPVPGTHAEDGLWEHALIIGGLVTLGTFAAAVYVPHGVLWWQITTAMAIITAVTWWNALNLTGSMGMAAYLGIWGACLTAWMTAARLSSPWHGMLILVLLLMFSSLTPTGVTVIRRHRHRAKVIAESGRDNANIREILHWKDLLPMFGLRGVIVRDVIRRNGGYEVHCRLGKVTPGAPAPSGIEAVRELPQKIEPHKRYRKGSVYIEEPDDTPGGSADFIIHVRSVTGPRLTRFLPADNGLLSVNRQFALGVHDNGRPFMLLLREVVVFIVGLVGWGKSTLMNIFIAQLSRMPDVIIFMIDLKGGQEARAWLMPWLRDWTEEPVIHWLATTRQEADAMLDALKRAGQARAESGRYGKKLRPSPQAPQFVVLCDESTVMTGHQVREDGLYNTQLATKLLQIAELFRSVAIVPVVSSVRAVVENTGKSGYKAMSGVRIGMKVASVEEGRQLFPDDLPAARQLAQIRDKGMFIPKVGAELHSPVHGYNITDGELDDDGNPTEDRITPIARACGTRERRPQPEQFVIDAMGEAYAKRWESENIRRLTQQWLAEAGDSLPPAPAEQSPDAPDSGDDDSFDYDYWEGKLNSGVGLDDDGDDPGRPLHPARKRMRQLLMQRGRDGYRAGILHEQLCSEGLNVARETVQRWLNADEKLGYVFRTDKPRSKWVWRLAPGAEFDLPGMDS
jgi:hypothetical protein